MSTPIALCLEDLDAPRDDERYLRCVARPGGEPGLGLDATGSVRWMPEGPEVFELVVSQDDRLLLIRSAGAPAVAVDRQQRSRQVPEDSPVVLLDQDLLRVAGRRLRVHFHGPTEEVHEPMFLSAGALARMARTAAAALALGATSLAGASSGPEPGQPPPIEVRERPPAKPAPRRTLCDILSLTLPKGTGLSLLELKCAAGDLVHKGMRGEVLDPKTNHPVKKGQLTVVRVSGGQVFAETRLKDLAGATKAQLWSF